MLNSLSFDKVRRFLNEKLRRNADNSPAATQLAAEHDLSYEDALLDLQISNYLKAEYGFEQPPSGVFPRLLAAIRAHERREPVIEGSRRVAAFMAVYRVLHSPATSKLVSGGIAAAVMIAVLSSNSVTFLRGTAVSFVSEESTPTPGLVLTEESATAIATDRDDRFLVRLPSAPVEPSFYDPAERRLPSRADAPSGRSTPSMWQRFGGQ